MIIVEVLLFAFIFIRVSAFSQWNVVYRFRKTSALLPSKLTPCLFHDSIQLGFRLKAVKDGNSIQNNVADGVRLNKAFKSTHSRRQADRLIKEGRVEVNGVVPDTMGIRLFPGDRVTLDGKVVKWQRLNQHDANNSNKKAASAGGRKKGAGGVHTYIKYWKPRGIECTTDRRVDRNIMDALGKIPSVNDRLFPMGRLDKDSTGLIIITSDGATTQRVLKSDTKKWKSYVVETDRRASNGDLQTLANGVRIQAPVQRDSGTKVRWIKTQNAIVERGPNVRQYPNQLLFKIFEGKNRQIRRMCEKVGLRVIRLHRVEFAGIKLDGCPLPGCWAFLTGEEIQQLKTGGD